MRQISGEQFKSSWFISQPGEVVVESDVDVNIDLEEDRGRGGKTSRR